MIDSFANTSEIHLFDAFAFHNQVDANPSAYGVTSPRGNCQTDMASGLVSDCSTYLFMDEWHPSAKAMELFADEMTPVALAMAPAAVVPVPAALPLFASALIGLGFLRRKNLYRPKLLNYISIFLNKSSIKT